jgi:membrane-bound serine protease (ClpP class)
MDGSRGARRRPVAFAAGGVLVGFLLLVAGSLAGSVAAQPATAPLVVRAVVDTSITPVIADYVSDAIARAERDGAEALVIELDTPGGLDTSMRDIVQDILDARVAVVVYVAPSGARAASAGAIIALSAHVAAMAPGTAIGAATPISGGGGEDLDDKIVNDAAAYAESLAQLRGRDVDFARDAVIDGRSISADEAVEIGAVDLSAGSFDDLLDAIDGRTVLVATGGGGEVEHVLRTEGAVVEDEELGLLRSIRQFLADPNLAFLFLSLGTLGLIYELATPGLGGGAAVSLVSFVLAFAGVAVLPINAVGLVFLVLAAVFFVVEVVAPGVGVAAVAGAVMLVLSAIFLFDDAPGLEVSLAAVLPVAIVTGALVVFASRLAMRSRHALSTTTGAGLFVGREVVVRTRDARPWTFVEGAWWTLRPSDAHPLDDGDRVIVTQVEDLELVVVPVEREEQV